jgi:GTPase
VVHVRDISHPRSEAQKADVMGVLAKLGMAALKRDEMIEFRNKIDLLGPEDRQAAYNAAERGAGVVAGSAVTGEGSDTLLTEIEALLFPRRMIFTLMLDHDQGRAVSWLYGHGDVQAREDGEAGVEITVEMTEKEFFQFQKEFGIAAAEMHRAAKAAQ